MSQNPLISYLQKTPADQLDAGFVAYLAQMTEVSKVAPTVAKSIVQELADQRRYLKLIASEARDLSAKLSPTQIQEHAKRHAGEQQVDKNPQHTTELLKRLKQSRKWLRDVCADLNAASRLEQKATPAADPLTDRENLDPPT